MTNLLTEINATRLIALSYIAALTAALFYTGNNVWLFTSSYLLIITSFAITFKQRFSRPIQISFNGIFISAVLLLTWFAISIFPSQVKYLTLYNFFWVGSLIIVFLISIFNDNQDKLWLNLWPGILLLVSIWAIYGLVQYYYLHVPANATFLNRNSLAALINLALIPAIAYFLLDKEDRPWEFLSNKILSLILLLLFLTIFIITSRGASLSLLTGLILLLVLIRKQLLNTQLKSLFVIIFISFLISYLPEQFLHLAHTDFAERMISLKDTSSAGNTRFIIWKSLIPLFQTMPWYGIGMGSLWLFWRPFRPAIDHSAGYFAHNDYMQITLEAGYPGIILLFALFVFILLNVRRALKTDLTKLQRVELVALFSALVTFATHSLFTYNFYILPLLIISGLYLARIQYLVTPSSTSLKSIPAFKNSFKLFTYVISLTGIVLILVTYFVSISLSQYYNQQAKQLMIQHKFKEANNTFLKSQQLGPLMDNPFFSHADMLRRGANQLLQVHKQRQANLLLALALDKLNQAEKRNPLRPQIFHIRGLILKATQPDKAKQQFEKALKLDPRFLFSRIQLAELLHQENHLKAAMEVLYEGVNYTYPTNKAMLEYMQLFAKYSREAGVDSFAQHLESNIKRFFIVNGSK